MGRYKYKRIDGKMRKAHDVVWEQTHGKPLPKGWIVHHIDGNGKNNDPSNLVAMPREDHRTLHAKLKREGKDPVDATDPDVIHERQLCKEYQERHRDEIIEARKKTKARTDAYNRQYHAEHRDEINARHRAYNLDHAEDRKAYREAHREERAAYNKRYAQEHHEERLQYQRDYYSRNLEKCREYDRQYRARINELVKARYALKKAIERGLDSETIASLQERVSQLKEKLLKKKT